MARAAKEREQSEVEIFRRRVLRLESALAEVASSVETGGAQGLDSTANSSVLTELAAFRAELQEREAELLERQTALRGRAELLLALTSDPSEGLGEELLEDAIMEETKGGEEDGIPEADADGDSSSSRSVVRKSTADLVQELMETRSQLPADLTRVTNQRRTCTPADAELLSSLAGMARGDQMLAESEEMSAASDEVEEEDTSPLRGRTASSTRSRMSTNSTQVIQSWDHPMNLSSLHLRRRVWGVCAMRVRSRPCNPPCLSTKQSSQRLTPTWTWRSRPPPPPWPQMQPPQPTPQTSRLLVTIFFFFDNFLNFFFLNLFLILKRLISLSPPTGTNYHTMIGIWRCGCHSGSTC